MAIIDDRNTNTTTSIRKASTTLTGKCERTSKNMKKLMADAGCAEYKTVKTHIPLEMANSGDDVLYVGLNGVSFYFLKGKTVDMPEPLLEICKNSGII